MHNDGVFAKRERPRMQETAYHGAVRGMRWRLHVETPPLVGAEALHPGDSRARRTNGLEEVWALTRGQFI